MKISFKPNRLKHILIGIMAVSLLFGCIFWIADSYYGYYMFSERVRYLLYQEPLSFMDSLVLRIPPHDLFVRISFFVACILGGGLISKFASDLKRSEQRQRVAAERMELALQGADLGAWDWNVQTDEIKFDERWANMLGYTLDELEPHIRTWKTRIHADDIESVEAALNAHLAGQTEAYESEHRLRHKSGTWIWVLDKGRVITRDADGKPLRACGTDLDITERKQAEVEREQLLTQVQMQARQTQGIMDTVPEGVLLLNAEARVVMANPAAREALSALIGVEQGLPQAPITHLGDRRLVDLLTSPPTRGLWHEAKAGHQIFEIIARPMANGSRPENWVLVVNDVTQERAVQAHLQQQERLAAVGQLAAGIAHDFNNIMTSILLYAQMTARAPSLSERQRERMQVIHQQAWHATQLITQILDFSRRTVLERRPMNLLPLLKEQIKLLKRTLPENIEITLHYEEEEKEVAYTVNADPTRMQQLLTNLAVNARDAMPRGGTLGFAIDHITVPNHKAAPLPEVGPGEWVRLTVSDTGIGIAPDVLPHIFEPFFTTKKPGQGSGLGLAQVHGIVGLHGGYIDVHTHIDTGTTFTIYLPMPETCPAQVPQPDISAIPQGQGETLLVVEDEDTVRSALVESLEQLNYRVLEAANGEQALAVLDTHAHHIALVLSDVVMPGMGGKALFYALQQRGSHIPMLMLTGHPMDKDLEELLNQGLNTWLPKPPDLNRLAHAVTEALQGRD